MTVKTLNDVEKATICRLFQAKERNQKELAADFQTSARTINRVLNEAGLATAVPRLKGEAYRAVQTLKAWGITPDQLQNILSTLEDAHLIKVVDGQVLVNNAPGGVHIGADGKAVARVSDEQVEVVLEEALADVRQRSGLTPQQPDMTGTLPDLRAPSPDDYASPWRVSEHYDLFSREKKVLMLSVGTDQIRMRAGDTNFIRWVAGSNIASQQVTREQVVQFGMRLDQPQFDRLLSDIVTARVAKGATTHTQTAMLNLQKKVEANAQENDEQRRK